MAMCNECGNVVGVDEIENGICKTCIAGGIVPEAIVVNNSLEGVKISNFGNPFSFRGRSGRLDYLAYGILLSYTLMISGMIVGAKLANITILYGLVIFGVIIALASTVRRARDRDENIVLVLILAMIPYVGFIVALFLLLAPGKRDKRSVESGSEKIGSEEVEKELE